MRAQPMVVIVPIVSFLVALGSSPSPEMALGAPPRPREVVVLYSDRHADVETVLRERLRAAPGGVHIITEDLDLARLEDQDYEARVVGILQRKYRGRQVDMVIPVFPPAIRFMAEHGGAVFPGAPVVFCYADAEQLARFPLPPFIAGIFGRVAGLPTVEAALKLQPGTRRVLLVAGESAQDRYWRERLVKELRVLEGRVEIDAPQGLAMADLLDRLRTLPDGTIVLFTTYSGDAYGSLYAVDAIRLVADASRVPVYGATGLAVGAGAVGGYVFDLDREAEKAAGVALRIFAGERPEQIGVHEAALNFIFDWRQLHRWKLSESLLPAGSEVLFRPPSPWDLYRGQILAGIGVLVFQSALVVGLLIQGARRRRAELEAGRLREDLAHLTRVSTLGQLAGSLAHELNQPLTAILANVQAAQMLMKRPSPDLEEIREILAEVVTDDKRAGEVIRRLGSLFRKGARERVPLDVNELIREVLRMLNNDIVLRGASLRTDLTTGLPLVEGDRIQLQQVVLNLAVNGLDAMTDQPAGRRHLTIKSGLAETNMRIEVADTGPGIDEADRERLFQPFFTTKPTGMGMGLAIARSIVEAHGGSLSVASRPGPGAVFQVTFPTNVTAST